MTGMAEKQRAIRLGGFVVLSAAIVGFVLSCQDRQASMSLQPAAPMDTATAVQQTKPVIDISFARKMGFTYAPAIPDRPKAKENEGSESCVSCHDPDAHSMHPANVVASCVDCHGGNGAKNAADTTFDAQRNRAHVQPKLRALWQDPKKPSRISSANPQIPGAQTNLESPDYIRFVNPGDLRAAWVACYACHQDQVGKVSKNIMTTGAMLWEAALYNNGDINRKNAVYGEAYWPDGTPARVVAKPRPTTRQTEERGWLSGLLPLPRWEISQPGNILRVFERGGEIVPNVGVPNPEEDPGRPDVKLSTRGFGTALRTDPVFIGLQKTRLLDPTLSLWGTNDHPGDYRGSGCSACHVVYGNDRSPLHSAVWAQYGNRGTTASSDLQVPRNESGHPIRHSFVQNMPVSTCIVCHVHPGTNVVNAYLGFMWWDNETDGKFMYPSKQRNLTTDDEFFANQHNPEQAAARGLWSNNPKYADDTNSYGIRQGTDFLERLYDLNGDGHLKYSVFADFHGHGWVFRAVFKKDRHGHLLDREGNIVDSPSRDALVQAVNYYQGQPKPPENSPVHLKDIHLEMGMQCVDCHFETDEHGDGHLYGATRDAVSVTCVDCHGAADQPAKLMQWLKEKASDDDADTKDQKMAALLNTAFTGNAAKAANSDTQAYWKRLLNRGKQQKFELRGGKLFQRSAVYAEDPGAGKKKGLPEGWFVVQTTDTTDPGSAWSKDEKSHAKDAAPRARYAHTVQRSGKWGNPLPANHPDLAHGSNVSCYACHTSWNTSCFGCHLPMRANWKKQMLHNEGVDTRNYTNYNYQTLRDDLYMLGKDGTVEGGQCVPVRSACAVVVSSQNANRDWLYEQQQTVSAEGFAGTSFSPYFPHTVRAAETRQCADCHVSKQGDNNAIMAQLLMQGTNAVNFIGRYCYVAEGDEGLQAVAVTRQEEPQAVIGSTLDQIVYPDFFRQHAARGGELAESYEHAGTVRDVQLRGEYLYAACGSNGFIAYDVANIDNKDFSERIITAPVSPLGQRFYVPSQDATSICSPSTLALDPTRPHRPENEEQKVHPLYAYLYMTDAKEGLIVIGNPADSPYKAGVATLLDGNPENNFLQRALTYNPGGLLAGAQNITLYGHYAYIACDAGLVVLNLDDPLHPQHVTTLSDGLRRPRKVQFQLRYGFVLDEDGMKVIDVTFPEQPRLVDGAMVPIADARDIYISRTYGYVAAGAEGLLVLDLERPEHPTPKMAVNRDASGNVIIGDAHAVKIGMTNASMFAYVADGEYGLKVLQLTSPEDTPTYQGYIPDLNPRLVAKLKTEGPALAISEGVDRDRAVDESGHQLSVFGRRGARPFNLEEQQRLYLRDDGKGGKVLYTVNDTPETAPEAPPAKPSGEKPKPKPAPTDEGLPGLP